MTFELGADCAGALEVAFLERELEFMESVMASVREEYRGTVTEAMLLWLWRRTCGCGELVEGSFRAISRGVEKKVMWKTFVPRGTF